MTVYLLHFEKPLAHSSHYLGFCVEADPSKRLTTHGTSKGARILRACRAAGIDYRLAVIIPGADRTFERKIKNRKSAPQWCPCCGLNTRPVPVFDKTRPPIIIPPRAAWAWSKAA